MMLALAAEAGEAEEESKAMTVTTDSAIAGSSGVRVKVGSSNNLTDLAVEQAQAIGRDRTISTLDRKFNEGIGAQQGFDLAKI